jgi:hypothetical protein
MRNLTVAVCSATLASAASAADAFRNVTTPLNSFHTLLAQGETNSPERGNTVTLAGADRYATLLELRVRAADAPQGFGAALFRVRLYSNNGPGGAPGTRLWDSGYTMRNFDSGADMWMIFRVPGVLLPETVTYTLQLAERMGPNLQAIGPARYGPPTTGSVAAGVWEYSGAGNWTQIAPAEPAWGARIEVCYSNCDASSTAPTLNVQDFTCFLQKFAIADPYANCDNSTQTPTLNVLDFSCFLQKYAAGCP